MGRIGVKKWLLYEQMHRCYYCQFEVEVIGIEGSAVQYEATLDHIVPREYGGDNSPENIVVACRLCNETRMHFRNYLVFREVIQELLKNETVFLRWHRFTKDELRMVRQVVHKRLGQIDPEWAFEITERSILGKAWY